MNATQQLVTDHLTVNGLTTVPELMELTGKGETTVRKALKELVLAGDVVKDEKAYRLTVLAPVEDKPTKRYQRHDTPTTRTTRTNQITKCEVRVTRTDEDEALAKEHSVKTKWMTVCETHNHAVGTDKVLDAHWFSSYPLFCTETRKLTQAAVGRRRATGTDSYPTEAKRWMPREAK